MIDDPSHFGPVADAGCEGHLGAHAARCEQAASEDGADESSLVDEPGAGCVQAEDVASDQPARKTPPTTLREFEHALRELGFTRSEATAIARGGFKALGTAPPTVDLQSLRQALMHRAAALNTES